MLIKVEDLKEGDEIIISSHANLKYLKVLRTPQTGKHTHWKTGAPLYKAVKCSINQQVHTGVGYSFKSFVCTPDDHNGVFYKDLNDRDIWLVKRKKQ